MLRCDNCNDIIIEPSEEEFRAQLDDVDELEDQPDGAEGESGRRRRKKKKPAPPAPAKRSSLVTLPFRRAVNGYDVKDFDLCPSCRAKLDKLLDDLRFNFAQFMGMRTYWIVIDDHWTEGVAIEAPDVEQAVRQYNEEACVNATIDVYRILYGTYQYEGRFILREGGYLNASS